MCCCCCCCCHQGQLPSGSEAITVNAALGVSSTSDKLCWVNPLDCAARVRVVLKSSEVKDTFQLLLPGTGPAAEHTAPGLTAGDASAQLDPSKMMKEKMRQRFPGTFW